MGGCRCTYRNCSLRTDGKTHMFHYPVFDKVRCHQWLTNAHKLEFLNLKVSQLRNRVVCQHHFKDDNFMNFKKDKLTFDAVPTENGPFCDSSQLQETKPEQEESKVFSISLDDIENEYLTIVDKKANFSVKYGDFLTNCDLMDIDSLNSLNQINENNQISKKAPCAAATRPMAPKAQKDIIPFQRPFKNLRPLMHNRKRNRVKAITRKNKEVQDNRTINRDSTVDISNLIGIPQRDENQKSLNLVLNVSHVPIEFEGGIPNDKFLENNDPSTDVKLVDESVLHVQPFQLKVLDEPKLLNEQSFDVKVFDEPKLFDDQSFNIKVLDEPKILNKQPYDLTVLDKPKPSNSNAGRSSIREKNKIRIISEKKISEPVSLNGKLEPVSPTRILTFPNKRRLNPLPEFSEVPIVNNSTAETAQIAGDLPVHNILPEQSEIEPINIVSRGRDVAPQEINDALNITQNEVIVNNNNNASTQKARSHETNRMHKKVLPKTSLLKDKIPPERAAAIAEKRKFNMKLRDIVEDCLDKLDEPEKTDFDKRKVLHKTSKKQQVSSYLAKDPDLPGVQEYTIAFLEARMKKMENNLLSKIGENSQKITELKELVAPPCIKKSVHTQTLVSEDVHKKQLYQELSKYLSQEANSLLYEELFINKFTKDAPKGSRSVKRRKCR